MATKLIIDVDTGVDDSEAIMLALSRSNVEILAITCVNGNVAIDNVCKNTLRVLKVCGRLDVPVYKGACRSMVGTKKHAEAHGDDGQGDVMNPEPVDMSLMQPEHAVNAILRITDENPGEITLIALAPLTNVALALRLDPDFGRKLKEVFIMGGNIEGRGNKNLGAEFNFYADPEAAYITLHELKCPTNLLSLEAAEANGIEWEWYDRWVNMDTRKSRFIKAFSRKTAEFNRTLLKHPKYSPYDLLTMATAIDQTVITESVDEWCTVEIGGNHTRGQLVVDWENKMGNKLNVRIIKKVNTDKTKAYFMSMAM
ncbi:inosine-uridine preferring nucleoside hydrolase-like [Mytilus californianus]|uniref:inosine-uridine preferring nucleoside hydrolase-like n=1 Tax=Mytilus californianus TaxID=6549 RepID=UPI002247897F|nr:inosine-uridine preferring nucleoside hydrolase-like [Mytilus californianus]